MIVTHGWPGSIIEQLKIIEPLTNPTAHGGDAADAFHLVIPSLPGYGFSAKPTSTGWDRVRIARAWVVLMKRLGYTRFVAQGGDWGAAVTLGARVAANAVLPELRDGRGSLLFTGGGFALHPSKEYASLSVGKAALRAYVQVLHGQLAGTRVHATIVTITKGIGSEPRFDAAALAEAYLDLHHQPEAEWQPELVI